MSQNKITLALCFILILFGTYCTEGKSRKKRYILVFPLGGTFKSVIGIGVPIKVGLLQSLSYSLNFQFQYPTATNITQLETNYPPDYSRTLQKREVKYNDRQMLYRGLEIVLDRYGIEGKSCLLRSICENAQESFFHESNGLYGQLLHILLTPDYGDGRVDEDLDPEYTAAMHEGRYGLDCFKLYSDCNTGLLDMISIMKNF